MKNIKERELLVNFARSMGQAVDPELVKEVDKLVPTYEPDDGPLTEEQIEQIKELL
jgi:hypothetical protein